MSGMNMSEENITNLQENLTLIRRAAGWSVNEFADILGVTRQTIFNLETCRHKMSKTQYIAITAVFNAVSKLNPDNYILKYLVETKEITPKVNAFLSGAIDLGLDNEIVKESMNRLVAK